ncbi:MAG: hypothetical protein ACLPHP_24065 [Candidatus Sulfotelmatobacter sp.]
MFGFLKRAVLVIALSTAALLAGVSVYFRIEQYRFRRQAERLLADVRELELKKTSANEVRLVVKKWGFEEWRAYKPCTEDDCMYRFQLMPKPAREHNLPDPFTGGVAARVYDWLGLRPTEVEAWLQMRGKVLRFASFTVYTLGRGCGGNDCTLKAYAGTKWGGSFGGHDRPEVKLRHFLSHPSYLVGTYPSALGSYGFSGVAVWAEFSPDANAADVSRLMQFDLSCLTRLRPCRDRDLVPTIWAQTVEDNRESPKSLTCAPESSWRVAQLADMIAVVRPKTIELSPPRYEGWPPHLSCVEIVSVIKKIKFQRQSDLNVDVDSPETTTTADIRSPIRAGQQYIFLMQDQDHSSGWTALYPCGVLTLNDANLAMVREVAANSQPDLQ